MARLGQILVGTDHGPTADEWVADMAAVCAEIGVEYVVEGRVRAWGVGLPVSPLLGSYPVFWDWIMELV